MRKIIFLILTALFLLCGCEKKEQASPSAVTEAAVLPEESPVVTPVEDTAVEKEVEPGERMYNSFVYSTLDTDGKRIWRGPEAGIKEFRVPESFTNAKGGLRAYAGFETEPGTGFTRTDFMYIPASEEAYDALIAEYSAILAEGMNDEAFIARIDEASIKFQNSLAVLFSLIGVPNNGDQNEAKEFIKKSLINNWLLSEAEASAQMETYSFLPAGSAEDYQFFLAYSPETTRNAFDGDKASWREEYDALYAEIPTYPAFFTFARPEGLANMTSSGTTLHFETTDLDGNPVSSSELFSGHTATMVNIWTTTCTGCISEMPQLTRLAADLAEKGGQIIGIVYDAEDGELVNDAKDIVSDLKVGFTNILPTAEIKQTLVVQSFPTTYFVNEKGELVSDPIVGSQVHAYQVRMNELLGE